jgi:hypothetical protein
MRRLVSQDNQPAAKTLRAAEVGLSAVPDHGHGSAVDSYVGPGGVQPLRVRPTRVNRCQSPTSTANPNPVNVAIPRRQHNRSTSGAKPLVAAISTIAASVGAHVIP